MAAFFVLCFFFISCNEETPANSGEIEEPSEKPGDEPGDDPNDDPGEEIFVETRLPIIRINTRNSAPVVSKDNWLYMALTVDSENPKHSFVKNSGSDQIRGRGNSSWNWDKKPYRIRFNDRTSMFGLTPARNWVLLANYKTATLMTDTVPYELGHRFDGPLFKNNYKYVELHLNDVYKGIYILTEHMRPGPGRVEIDDFDDYLVELSFQFDEEPKWETEHWKLPVMIKSPEYSLNINDPRYKFVVDSMNEFDAALAKSSNFPNNNWKDILDMDSFVDYIMINEITHNHELENPGSVYMCKIAGQKLRMSHLWDFDWAYAMWDKRSINVDSYNWKVPLGLFGRFFEDSEFKAKYRARWNEKYDDILSMTDYMEELYLIIKDAYPMDNALWHGGRDNLRVEVDKLKQWWTNRVAHLNWDINRR